MGMFSRALDDLIQVRFRKGESGRLVFLPFSARRGGYYVDPSNEFAIKSLVKLYAVASALINLVGSLCCYALTSALIGYHRSVPLAKQIETMVAVYVVAAFFLYILPALILWKVYRGMVTGFCSPLTVVAPEAILQMNQPSSRLRNRLVAVCVVCGLMALGVGLLVASSYRPRRTEPTTLQQPATACPETTCR